MKDVDWDNLRFVVAIARAGSIRAAAKDLRVNHATVSRRLSTLHDRLGVRLFERRGRGLAITTAGSELLDTALEIEAQILDVGRRLEGQDIRLQGTVRIALPSSFVNVLAPVLPCFSRRFPGITLELATGVSLKNLNRSEADVAVRITDDPDETLVGRRISGFAVTAYGRHDLLDSIEPCELADYPWLGWPERFERFAVVRWLWAEVPTAHYRVLTNSETGSYDLIRAGAGVGFIPCVLGHCDRTLRRLTPASPVFSTSLWVLTHPDLRQTPRIQSVTRWISEVLKARENDLTGGMELGNGPRLIAKGS